MSFDILFGEDYTCIHFFLSYVMPSKFYSQNWEQLLVDGCYTNLQVGQHKFVCVVLYKYMCSS